MPRYELDNRFWEAWLDGNTLVSRHGSKTSNGRASRKELASREKAEKELAKRTAATLAKGFVCVSPTQEESLPQQTIAAILDDPRDDDAYLVLGDHLLAQGHPRGELITVQHAREGNPRGKMAKLGRSEAELWKAHPELALPPRFAEAAKKAKRSDKAASGYCHYEWRCGYLRSATIGRNSNKPPYSVRELTLELLTHPSARFLAELTIGALGVKGDYDYRDIVEALLIARPGSLRRLVLADFDSEEHSDVSCAELGEVGRLGEATPRLEELTLRSGKLDVTGLALSELRALRVDTVLNPRGLEALLALELPKLETLELCCNGFAPPPALLAPLLSGAVYPRLARLALTKSTGTTAIVSELLAREALAGRLLSLDLSSGALDDDGARALANGAAAFAQLQQLDLSDNHIGDAPAAALSANFGERVTLGDQSAVTAVSESLLTLEQIRDAAADAKSVKAARGLAKLDDWRALGHGASQQVLWGECRGSYGYYHTLVNLPSLSTECSCPSFKLPCKHALALMLLAAAGQVPPAAMPAGHAAQAEDTR